MLRIKTLKNVLRQTKADRILISYLIFMVIDATIIWISDPSITSLEDAIWFCCTVISTTGFGDVVATTLVSRIATIILMIYSVFVVAIVTGVIVNYYNQIINIRQDDTVAAFLNKLERLPEMSKEELEQLSQNVKKYLKE